MVAEAPKKPVASAASVEAAEPEALVPVAVEPEALAVVVDEVALICGGFWAPHGCAVLQFVTQSLLPDPQFAAHWSLKVVQV